MVFDGIIVAAITAELNRVLSGGRVDKIQQPTPLDVVITIRSRGANYTLLISANADSPRIHLTSTRRPNPPTAPNFCMILRKHLEGASIVGIRQIDFDRIIHLVFSTYDGEQITLIIEIMGKHSNVILISGAHRILGAIKPVGRKQNRFREILPGKQYSAPPAQDKINPLHTSKEDFDVLVADTFSDKESARTEEIASWLGRKFIGLGAFASRELAARSEGNLARLSEQFREFFNRIASNDILPVLITDDAGRVEGFYVFRSIQYSEANQHERSSINLVADMYYTSALPRDELDERRDELIARIHWELESRTRAIDLIREGLAASETAGRLKEIGELILSQAASIPAGADSADLVDYYDADTPSITVGLDARLSGPENAEAYFRKFQKSVLAASALRDRLAETQEKINMLGQVLDSATSAASLEEVDELTSRLAGQGLCARKQTTAAQKRMPEFEGHRIAKRISNGWEILVGQNSESNDYLLTRVAKPNDLWLHVKASPSAHVVISNEREAGFGPRSVLYAAAELAAQHSNSKHSSLIPVDYTLRKYVRKPRGASAGKVIYQNEKTVYVTTTS